MSQQRHHSPTVVPIPNSQGDCGMSSGLPCPSTDITVPLSFPSHCPKGTAGCPQDSPVPAETSQSPCPFPSHCPKGTCGVSSGLPCPSRDITVPLSFPSQSPEGTAGCPQDSHVPAETSQSHCPSHPKVPRGLRGVLRTPMSQQRHHGPTVLPIPLSQGDCGMSSGLPCPSTDITIPLSFPSHCPKGLWDVLRTPMSQQRHHSSTVLPIPKSQGDCGVSTGLPCPSTDITVPLFFPSHCPKGTAECPQDSPVPAQTSQSHCPSHPTVPRDCGMSSGLPCPSRDITVPLFFPSQSPKGTVECPQDSHVPAQTSQSHCPSHPTVPRGLQNVLRTPLSQHRHHNPTVLPIPLSQGDCGMSSGLPCPSRDITVPLFFPSQSPKGTVGCPQDSHVPAETSQSHCPSHPKVPRGLWDVLRTPMSQHRHHSPTVLPIPLSQGDCGMSSGLPCPSTDITVPLSFPSQSPKGTAGCPRDSRLTVLPISKFHDHEPTWLL